MLETQGQILIFAGLLVGSLAVWLTNDRKVVIGYLWIVAIVVVAAGFLKL